MAKQGVTRRNVSKAAKQGGTWRVVAAHGGTRKPAACQYNFRNIIVSAPAGTHALLSEFLANFVGHMYSDKFQVFEGILTSDATSET